MFKLTNIYVGKIYWITLRDIKMSQLDSYELN